MKVAASRQYLVDVQSLSHADRATRVVASRSTAGAMWIAVGVSIELILIKNSSLIFFAYTMACGCLFFSFTIK